MALSCPHPGVCGCANSVAWLPDLALERLQEMGFSAKDCREALRQCEEDLNMAALWLNVHATPISTPPCAGGQGKRGATQRPGSDKGDSTFSLTAIEVRDINHCNISKKCKPYIYNDKIVLLVVIMNRRKRRSKEASNSLSLSLILVMIDGVGLELKKICIVCACTHV